MKAGKLAAIAVMALGVTSCDRYVNTLRNETSEEVRWYSADFHVDRWTKVYDADGLNGYYKADVKVSYLDYAVLRGGQVNCYLYTSTETQTPLPNVRHYENSAGQRWTRTIDYEYYSGGLTIYVTDNDFACDVPGGMYFRVVYSW